jgi:hypothetical protein
MYSAMHMCTLVSLKRKDVKANYGYRLFIPSLLLGDCIYINERVTSVFQRQQNRSFTKQKKWAESNFFLLFPTPLRPLIRTISMQKGNRLYTVRLFRRGGSEHNAQSIWQVHQPKSGLNGVPGRYVASPNLTPTLQLQPLPLCFLRDFTRLAIKITGEKHGQ